MFSVDIDSIIIQTLSDNDPSTSTLRHFHELRSEQERNLLLFIFRSNVYLIGGYRLTKRPTRVLLDTLKVACPYAPDNRLFVTCLPAAAVIRKVAHAIESRRGDTISLAEMEWSWDILRLADLLGDETDTFNAFIL